MLSASCATVSSCCAMQSTTPTLSVRRSKYSSSCSTAPSVHTSLRGGISWLLLSLQSRHCFRVREDLASLNLCAAFNQLLERDREFSSLRLVHPTHLQWPTTRACLLGVDHWFRLIHNIIQELP